MGENAREPAPSLLGKCDCCSPFGAMIKPFVDAMSVSPEGGHALFDSSGNIGMEPEAAVASSPRIPGTESSTSETAAGQDVKSDIKVPPIVTYSDDTVLVLLLCVLLSNFGQYNLFGLLTVFVQALLRQICRGLQFLIINYLINLSLQNTNIN